MSAAAAALVLASFALGAIPFGVVVSRLFFHRDLRAAGSGNIGAANALRTLGKRGAVAVLVLDALKGVLPVVAARALDGSTLAAVAAFAAVAGHCFSPFLNFRGGKGVATSFGAIAALAWPAGCAFAIVWLAAAIAHRLLLGGIAAGEPRGGSCALVLRRGSRSRLRRRGGAAGRLHASREHRPAARRHGKRAAAVPPSEVQGVGARLG